MPQEIITAAGSPAPRRVFEAKPSRDARPVPAAFSDTFRNNGHDENAEREMLIRVLRECGGNKALAARKLGIPRSTYFSKLKKYSIDV